MATYQLLLNVARSAWKA